MRAMRIGEGFHMMAFRVEREYEYAQHRGLRSEGGGDSIRYGVSKVLIVEWLQ